jgi:hypothetical protein
VIERKEEYCRKEGKWRAYDPGQGRDRCLAISMFYKQEYFYLIFAVQK